MLEEFRWVDDTTLEIYLRQGVRFQDGEPLTAKHFEQSFVELQRWRAPHPPGTYLNWHPDTGVEIVDDHTVRMLFPSPRGLAMGKFRGMHIMSSRFWDELGYGYRELGTGEGHW